MVQKIGALCTVQIAAQFDIPQEPIRRDLLVGSMHSLMAQRDSDAAQRPIVSGGIHAQRHRGAGAEPARRYS